MIKSKEPIKSPKELKDYAPGSSRSEILRALKKVATSPKPSQKHGEQPAPTSKET